MTVNEMIQSLEELKRVGMGESLVVCVASLSGQTTLFETRDAGGIYLERRTGSTRQRYEARGAGDIHAVIIQ